MQALDQVTAETIRHEIAEAEAERYYNAQLRGAKDDCTFTKFEYLNSEHAPLDGVDSNEMLIAFACSDDPVAFQKALHKHAFDLAVNDQMYQRGFDEYAPELPDILRLEA